MLLYGHHLGDGYLADDYLYLGWLDHGLTELLRRVTWQSDPQMIRPLPALAWMLSWIPGGAVAQHALSLILHGLTGGLLARRLTSELRRCQGLDGPTSASAGGLYGALFVAFPLLTEPVIWLSSATDLWATVLALASLELAFPLTPERPVGGGRSALAGGVFAAALLCKESVLLLPLIAVALRPGDRKAFARPTRWLPHAMLAGLAGLYLVGRWLLFQGPGGYLEADGTSQALTFDPSTALRNLGLQLPWRLLWPLIRDESLPWWGWLALGGTSLLLATGFVQSSLRTAPPSAWRRRGRDLAVVGIAVGAAFLPVLPVLSVDSDHGGGRLLYWPMAIALWAVGRRLPWTPRQKHWGLALVIFWSLATLYNGTAWSGASRRLQATLQQLPQISRQLATRPKVGSAVERPTIVYIDGHDSWRGAYLWRNGFLAALRRHGIGGGVDWRLGSGALAERASDLGRNTFVWALDAELRLVDRTPCEQALAQSLCRCQAPAEGLLAGTVKMCFGRCQAPAESLPGSLPEGCTDRCQAPAGNTADNSLIALRLRVNGSQNRPLRGRLMWRRGSRARFNISDSKAFQLSKARPQTTLLLGPLRDAGAWQVRLQLEEPGRVGEIVEVVRVTVPEVCR